jgi:hypothetical protein
MPAHSDSAVRQWRPLSVSGALAALFVAALLVLIAVAVHRETSASPAAAPAISMTERTSERPPMTAPEEAFATALWAVHAQVRQDAVRMTYAGLAYKMGDIDAPKLKARVAPLAKRFEDSVAQVRQLVPPAELAPVRERYQAAVQRYAQAARTMLRAEGAHTNEQLLAAQQLSQQSSEDLLRVSDVLWPGEHKPN